MIRKSIKFFFNILGFDILRINSKYKKLSFDNIHKKITNCNNPIIFDVGANKGQSIKRFRKIFPNSTIHAFEPVIEDFNNLKKEYNDDKKIFLNNFALGDNFGKGMFNITTSSLHSSFYKLNLNTEWIRIRSKEFNVTEKQYTTKTVPINIDTINNYCSINNILKIDILKLDTQGYEDKILLGSSNILPKIKLIEIELMFDDVYEKRLNFYDIEKHLLQNNFRILALEPINFNNLLEGYMFCINAIYLNQDKHD
jgi:FkbM family methyltransferase